VTTPETPGTPIYHIRIKGHLGPEWSAWFEPMTVTRCDDGTTRIAGPLRDAAALYGLLARLRDLGATLLRVERRDPAAPPETGEGS
jgi:hypothetical protein